MIADDDKIIQSIDLIQTYTYGKCKDLTCETEKKWM